MSLPKKDLLFFTVLWLCELYQIKFTELGPDNTAPGGPGAAVVLVWVTATPGHQHGAGI